MQQRTPSTTCRGGLVGLTLIAALLATGPSVAQTIYTWGPLSGSQGSFNEPSDWSPVGIPGSADTARFNFGNNSTVNFNAQHTIAALQHWSGNTIFRPIGSNRGLEVTGNSTLTGGSLTIDSNGASLMYLDLMGTLTTSGGSTLTHNAGDFFHGNALRVGSSSSATMVINGPNAYYENYSTQQSALGYGNSNGFGTLQLNNGATAEFSAGLRIGGGPSAGGDLSVLGGSSLFFGTANIGDGSTAGQTATVLVAGSGSTVSQFGASTLSLGKTSNGSATISVNQGGSYTTGTGTTTIRNTGVLNVGDGSSAGTFDARGLVNVTGGTINVFNSNSVFTTPELTISGGQVTRNSGGLHISSVVTSTTNALTIGHDSGSGALTINSGGVLDNHGAASLGNNAGSTGTATVTGSGSQWNNATSLSVGLSGQGTLTISDGGSVTNAVGIVGFNNGSQGQATVTGTGSNWTQTSGLTIGVNNSSAVLTVEQGGTVQSSTGLIASNVGSQGEVTVTGAGSNWTLSNDLRVGNTGTATLSITDGGSVTSSGGGAIGFSSAGSGAAQVTGSGSQWNTQSSDMIVGYSGQGSLDIQDGGSVTSFAGRIGLNGTGSGAVNVTGGGSQWNSGNLFVGDSGLGNLTIADTANVTSNIGLIGNTQSGLGTATVTGAVSQWNLLGMEVGVQGQGTLNIEAGGVVTAASTLIGMESTAAGSVNVTGPGSHMNTGAGYVVVGINGSGSLNVTDGGVVSSEYGSLADSLGSASVTISGSGSQWNMTTDLYVGLGGQATLDVENGGFLSGRDGIIGIFGGSNGTATVSGNDARWVIARDLLIAPNANSQGALTIGPGGTVEVGEAMSLGNQAELTIQGGTLRLETDQYQHAAGSTSQFLFGTLELAGNRTIGTDAAISDLLGIVPDISLGRELRIDGTATLLAPATLNGGTLTVADLAGGSLLSLISGTLNITAADVHVGNAGTFGDSLNLGAGQTINVSQHAQVASDGLLTIANGGRFNADTLANFGEIQLAGNNARIATASATLTNHGLLFGDGRIDGAFVNTGTGIVHVADGKRLTFDSTVQNLAGGRITGRGTLVAPAIDNSGQLLFSGGFTDVFAAVTSEADAQVIVSGGATGTFYEAAEFKADAELRVSAGATAVFFDHVQLRTGALVTGSGQVFYEGSLGIGNSPARQVFSTHTTLSQTSNLIAQIGGPDPITPHHDQFVFTSSLTLGGGDLTLELISPDGTNPAYDPQHGDQFVLIEATGNFTGKFAKVHGVVIDPATALAVTYTGAQVLATVALPGDINLDGVVDEFDLALMAANWLGNGRTWSQGDLTGSGQVNIDDLYLLAGNWHSGAIPEATVEAIAASLTPVPEPGSLAVLVVGLGACLRRRRS